MADTPILLSHMLNASASANASAGETQSEILDALRDERLAWVHLDGTHPQAQDWIRTELDYLDPQAVEALLDRDTRPRTTVLGEGLMVILRGINFNEGEDREDMVSLRMYVDNCRIVTVARKGIRAINRMDDAIRVGRAPQTAGLFLVRLVEDLVGNIAGFQAELDEVVEALEVEVYGAGGDHLRRRVLNLRLKVIAARRYLGPQREALSKAAVAQSPVIDDLVRRELEEEVVKMTRVSEDMDELRDQAQVLREELSTQLSDRVNRNTFVLSVVSVIFLPLGFLTGLFGVNIDGMPGLRDGDAFFWLCFWCAVLVVCQVVFIWRMRWFKNS
ncbi:zinc transporter ZntB [Rhodobacteraceae bacterium]|nr:zinc transporter ZntB [Paracoccaceae bacterium]